jgi:glutathione S-transferase
MKLVLAPHSPDCVAAELYCRIAKADVLRVHVHPMTGTLSRQVPYLEEASGDVVAEGKHAVIKFLGSRFMAGADGVKRIWYSEHEHTARANVDRVLELVHELDVQLKVYVYHEGIIQLNKVDSDVEKPFHVLQAKVRIQRLFALLDKMIPDNGFFTGLVPSIADLSLISTLLRLTLVSFSLAPYPKLTNWMKLILKEVSPHFYDIAQAFGVQKDSVVFSAVHPLVQTSKLRVKKKQDIDYDHLEEEKFELLLGLIKEAQIWPDHSNDQSLICKQRIISPSEFQSYFST